MRKLTGYIGAMIIVIALMGSILAGYALNINGSTAVMNEYEKVTDVSGLYTHTQEPAYIDYNPASNYIGYNENENFISDPGMSYCKEVIGNETIKLTPTTITIDGRTITFPIQSYIVAFVTDKTYIQINSNAVIFIFNLSGQTTTTQEVTITTTENNVTVSWGANSYTYTDCYKKIRFSDNSDYDYYMIYGRQLGNTTDYTAYYSNKNDIVTISKMAPAFNSDTGDTNIITIGTKWVGIGTSAIYNNMPGTTGWMFNDSVLVGNGIYSINANYENWTHSGWDSSAQPIKTISGWFIFYPVTKTYSDLGINYTESNRVNNYPIETDYSTINGTSTASLDLMSMSAANQMRGKPYFGFGSSQYYINGWFSGMVRGYFFADNFTSYKVSDIISTLSPPSYTKVIRIEYNNEENLHYTYQYPVNGNNNINAYIDYNIPKNTVYFTTLSESYYNQSEKPLQRYSGWIDYNIDTGLCDCYNSNGTKFSTTTPDQICIGFEPSNKTTSTGKLFIDGEYEYEDTITYPIGTRPNPTLNIIYTTTGTITNVHYSDITRGYSIKDTNVTNTIWNNEYTNGNIQLLFRAENTPAYYHNDVTIGSNNISIDYNQNKYVVTLNSNDPVDIGMWRNIILDVDLINGKLSAIPVRTFNSFTNVVMENTKIFIGDLVGATPTNTIEWGPTPNSLLFNVYSTSVFMNTYGVVMMNPTLNITNYFTDLDNFYQLRLSGFSVYGQSMTVNGVTGTVTGNTITFNDETVQVKDMEITYADGHAYISDSYATIDLGAIVDNNVSMTGAWYFTTDLYDGYTTQKMVYDWDWGQFILGDKAFGVIYIGLCLIGLIVARHFCTLTVTDYIIFVVSIVFALTVPVIA